MARSFSTSRGLITPYAIFPVDNVSMMGDSFRVTG